MEQPNTEDIHSLVKKCLQGNHKAQYDLYHAFSKAMYNTCLRFLSDSRDAEEALQNAFILIFKNMESFRGDATIGAWIKKSKEKNLLEVHSNFYFFINEFSKRYEKNFLGLFPE